MTHPENPLVSIIIPSFNQGEYISQTLDSILDQDYRPIEVLVIDGASTDDTLDVLHRYDNCHEIDWVSEPDSGVVEAVNKGFKRAKGGIGAIQSSDDFYLPNTIRSGVEALCQYPENAFVFGDIIKIDAVGNELMHTNLKPFTLESVLSLQTWIPQPSTFFRLQLAKSLNGWREEVPYAADTDLWLRMAFRAPGRKIDVVVAKRRLHDAQRDTQGDRIARDYSRVLDTIPDLKTAPRPIRRAAAAGRLLMMNRYMSNQSYWVKMWRQWRAIMLYPPLRNTVPCGALIPGWFAFRNFLVRTRDRIDGIAN